MTSKTSTSYRFSQRNVDDIERLRKRWRMKSGKEVLVTLIDNAINQEVVFFGMPKEPTESLYESALITDGKSTSEHVVEYDE